MLNVSATQELAGRMEKLEEKASEVTKLEEEVAELKEMVAQPAESNKGIKVAERLGPPAN
jgi:cell shape-determining protein MreC